MLNHKCFSERHFVIMLRTKTRARVTTRNATDLILPNAKWTFCTRGDQQQVQIPRLLYFKRDGSDTIDVQSRIDYAARAAFGDPNAYFDHKTLIGKPKAQFL